MPRPACINLPELPLQVLFRRRPEWTQLPAAVVASTRPLARIEALNRPAAAVGIRRGMRYATALSLASDLRADVVTDTDLDAARNEVQQVLAEFSPEIERCGFDSEIFWVDTRGLVPLFSSRLEWAAQIKRRLAALGVHANIAVGFSRFGTFAWAKRRKSVRVFETPEEEEQAAVETPLSLLPFPPRILELTESLGLHSIGDFIKLPAEDIRKRLGAEALAIYRFATDAENLPLQGAPPEEEPEASVSPLAPIRSTDMLEHAISHLLEDLLDLVVRRGESIRELSITLDFEGGTTHTERIAPAQPSRSAETLERLVHLRLEHLTPTGGVRRVTLTADRVTVSFRQEELFVSEAGADLSAGEKAVATIRAELGNDAVVAARLFDEYLPEERFRFEPRQEVRPPTAGGSHGGGGSRGAGSRGGAGNIRRLVRRIRPTPLAISPPQDRPVDGPFTVSGHWWRLDDTHREYYYLHLPDGRTTWVYYDAGRGSWIEQGSVD